SRIIVKNLPAYLTQEAFAAHFQSFSTPTDAKLQLSKTGKSRRFGFVGYSQADQAERAVEHWHNTFIGTTKISAECARSIEQEQETNYKRKRTGEDALAIATAARERLKQKRKAEPEQEVDAQFEEFKRLNAKRSKTGTFLNDDGGFVQQAAVLPDEAMDEAEYEDLPQPAEETFEVIEAAEERPAAQIKSPQVDSVKPSAPTVDATADDAEWLRNRTSRLLDLDDSQQTSSIHIPAATTSTQPAKQAVIPARKTAPMTPAKTEEELDADCAADKQAAHDAAIETINDTARLFLRNLAFTVDEGALQSLFNSYGDLEEVHLPQADGKPKGTAFIKFRDANDAVTAFTALDGKQFHGRLLHILPGKAQIQVERPLAPGQKLNVGEKRKEERRKEAAKTRFNWNALYLDRNAVLETTAKKFGVAKSELLDPSQSNAAVTMALAEASALGNIRKFFLQHGVDLQSFRSTKQKDDAVLLFKNLPSSANEAAIRGLVESAGGVIRRLLMPEVGGLAIVEVTDGNMGKSVFSKLAYRKLGDGILYLEKGPVGTFNSPPPVQQSGEAEEEEEEDANEQESTATLFVKNLNFETRAPGLTRIFESLKGFRQATVKTKPDPRDSTARLSMGFGFVEFATEEDARQALSAMQGFKLDEHALELKFSNGKQVDKPKKGKLIGTKVVVKNLPFETTKQDVQRIFSTYGTLKSLRLPKKYNAHLRGFAFLEFVSKREAKNAIEAVSGTHLLGRRMILEYAEEEKEGDEGVDQLVEKTRKKRAAVES
ncbi:hypothetical protein BCR37DRAFT_340867, partial [Protomyces lactucae-debilis]